MACPFKGFYATVLCNTIPLSSPFHTVPLILLLILCLAKWGCLWKMSHRDRAAPKLSDKEGLWAVSSYSQLPRGSSSCFSRVPEAQSYSLIQHDLIHSIPAPMAESREPRVTSELIAWGRGSLGLCSVGLDRGSVRIHRLSFHICGTFPLIHKTPFGMRGTLWVT